jgi:HAD superfamily phosphoserine phosphatase-like hydrolase
MNKMKVLFLAANPRDTDKLALDEEIREISKKIREGDYRDAIELISAWAVRPDDLLQLLNQYRPQIIHFSGHGSGSGEIFLTDNNGISKPVSSRALKALFATLKDNIQIVVLNTCYSKEQAEAITEVIDVAIGMNDRIDDKSALTFAASFYRAIAFGIRPRHKRTQWSYQVVAFDLGGTLIRGGNSTYSWKLIWDYLELNQELHRNFIGRYFKGDWSYNDWCNHCCNLFIQEGLTKDDVEKIVKKLKLTKNFNKTINTLKEENFAVAIISGSIDTFLEIMVPNYRELFDYVYLNKFIFDKNGRLCGVIPTKYDFMGKTQALKEICQNVRCTMDEVVFIGDGINDQDAIIKSGLSIAYPPTDESVLNVSTVIIKEDDLALILPNILV